MKRFRFSLQSVLTLRQRREQTALEHYGRAVSERQQAVEALRVARVEWETICRLRTALLGSDAAAGDLARAQAYCRAMEETVVRYELDVLRAQRGVEQSWQKLLEARRAREVVDKYGQRQRESYDRAVQREEQKALDEMAQRRPENGAAGLLHAACDGGTQ
ncbi:MAG TPA: flagellar export protein FliJ [Verrucomicrobiae bacterium]|nr:flagellar export protein FliJ [Verrucomicrobiae bacterium]